MSQKETPSHLRNIWGWLIPLGVFGLLTAVTMLIALRRNDGHLIYAQDDAYIHLAMAKNLAFHGVWGVTRYAFSASSSSPLWTAMLALGMRLVGNHASLPFWYNLALGVALLILGERFLCRRGLTVPQRVLALCLLIVAMPLVPMVFSGMEHILHTVVMLAFLLALETVWETPQASKTRGLLLGLAALLPLVRYEGLFLVAVTAGLLIFRRRWGLGIGLVALAALPVAALGLWYVRQGWWFLPSSVLVKGSLGSGLGPVSLFSLILRRFLTNLALAPQMGFLLLGLLIGLITQWKRAQRLNGEVMLMLVVLGTSLLHLALAAVGPMMRYQAYLVASSLLVLAGPLFNLDLRRWFSTPALAHTAQALVAALILALAVLAGGYMTLNTPRATTNIYHQQVQMARFVRQFYNQSTVVLNDIGAVSYFTDAHVVDLAGLATREVAQARLNGTFGPQIISDLTRRADAVMIYTAWFPEELPAAWQIVGEWTIPENLICGDDTVTFLAPRADTAATLRTNLRTFAPYLPALVQQRGDYLNP
ncbi:hypothetical protein QYE77_07410 [Thermanaerothrix sp. 4228-RoL]|uniref:Glycosyltransferase RgtA/B/C/D-like domain-containing protein n=1 Tax=Thermanaerothrix solaris TaxID=3058434 RepID=A0ABU3NMM0_9CHLR|nr:hypothetical protein [Thermanaerothrix sp. 4228-RoL]MDT8898094.1 hypothetical protein [Thermanaerothrix sp. 4228-RoL]